jgi:hypothetical protein
MWVEGTVSPSGAPWVMQDCSEHKQDCNEQRRMK